MLAPPSPTKNGLFSCEECNNHNTEITGTHVVHVDKAEKYLYFYFIFRQLDINICYLGRGVTNTSEQFLNAVMFLRGKLPFCTMFQNESHSIEPLT